MTTKWRLRSLDLSVVGGGVLRQAAILLGAPNASANKMKRDPEFRRRARAVAAEADAQLTGAESPLPEPFGIKGKLPTDAESLGSRRGTICC